MCAHAGQLPNKHYFGRKEAKWVWVSGYQVNIGTILASDWECLFCQMCIWSDLGVRVTYEVA